MNWYEAFFNALLCPVICTNIMEQLKCHLSNKTLYFRNQINIIGFIGDDLSMQNSRWGLKVF